MSEQRRARWVDILLLGVSAGIVVGLVLLGNWQIQRLAWKLDLIEAVEARAFGEPVAVPGPNVYDPEEHAYLRVVMEGTYRHEDTAFVKAVTELGPGYWVMTPLDTGARIIWVNRGFVPLDEKEPSGWDLPRGSVTVTGLLRPDEPGGTLLERNRPEIDRWVSRDLGALSERAGLDSSAPFFVDAEHSAEADSWPRGGLTIVSFRNSHLSYALTWYAMALLFAGAVAFQVVSRMRANSRF
ncbi:SURF1 family protein [Amaricoccus macauensis]|uniref:SURF1 family protein n=1 Tax=Amaricoccus macauensis TaxID=57001 RepID=UPI003C7BA2FE